MAMYKFITKLDIETKTKAKTKIKVNIKKNMVIMNQIQDFGNFKDTSLKFLTLILIFLKMKNRNKMKKFKILTIINLSF